jgi:hypothetical protein
MRDNWLVAGHTRRRRTVYFGISRCSRPWRPRDPQLSYRNRVLRYVSLPLSAEVRTTMRRRSEEKASRALGRDEGQFYDGRSTKFGNYSLNDTPPRLSQEARSRASPPANHQQRNVLQRGRKEAPTAVLIPVALVINDIHSLVIAIILRITHNTSHTRHLSTSCSHVIVSSSTYYFFPCVQIYIVR